MGTIVFEQYTRAGSAAQTEAPIPKLDKSLIRTEDATTSTTAESITLNADTKIIRVYGVEKHRIALTSADTAANFATIYAAATPTEYGVNGGETIYYRLDA